MDVVKAKPLQAPSSTPSFDMSKSPMATPTPEDDAFARRFARGINPVSAGMSAAGY